MRSKENDIRAMKRIDRKVSVANRKFWLAIKHKADQTADRKINELLGRS